MGTCVKSYCDGNMVERISAYGTYWVCSKCGNKIDKKCSCCGGGMRFVTYNGSRAVSCKKCGAYDYGHK